MSKLGQSVQSNLHFKKFQPFYKFWGVANSLLQNGVLTGNIHRECSVVTDTTKTHTKKPQ